MVILISLGETHIANPACKTATSHVGYQGKELHLDNNYIVATFVKVGGEIADLKLGDIVGNDAFTHDSVQLQLLTPNGSTAKIDWPQSGDAQGSIYSQVDAQFVYLNEADTVIYGGTPGWYQVDDDYMFENPMNDFQIGFGNGFMIQCGDDTAKVMFSGAVYDDKYDVALHIDNNYTGNASPVEITLGDITGNDAFTHDSVQLQLLTPNGSTDKIDWPQSGEHQGEIYSQVDAQFVFLNEADTVIYGGTPGWYQVDDDYMFENLMNSLKIPAGSGIMLQCGDDTAVYQVPAAL